MAYGKRRRSGQVVVRRNAYPTPWRRLAFSGANTVARGVGRAVAGPIGGWALGQVSNAIARRFGGPPRTPRNRYRRSERGKVGTRRYLTKGVKAKFKRRTRPQKYNVFEKQGSVKHLEIGGTVSSRVGPNPEDEKRCLYVGHTTFDQIELLKILMRGIVRRLAFHCKQFFNNWQEPSNFGHTVQVRFYYRKGVDASGAVLVAQTATIPVGDTWESFENLCQLAFVTMQDTPDYNIQLLRVDIRDPSPNAAGSREVLASIDMEKALFDIEIVSKMRIQNRTVASVQDPDSDVMTDVSNNPLHGRRYMCSGNGLKPGQDTGTGVADKAMVGGYPNGILTYVPGDSEDMYRKPPRSTIFTNVKKQQTVDVKPGDIKTSYLKYTATMSVDNFLKAFRLHLYDMKVWYPNTLINLPKKHFCSLGKTELIAVEKLLDSRVDEPTISIGYELVQSFKGLVRLRKNLITAPIVDVRAAAHSTAV